MTARRLPHAALRIPKATILPAFLISRDPLLLGGGAGNRIGVKPIVADGSRRDPRSLAVGETYGKCWLPGSANPTGVEFDPCRVGASIRKGSSLRRFHLRLMMLMPFGHSSCRASTWFNAYGKHPCLGPCSHRLILRTGRSARTTSILAVYLSLALASAVTIMVPGKESSGRGARVREILAARRGALWRCRHDRDRSGGSLTTLSFEENDLSPNTCESY
ncbi:hypothetical protein SBA2_670003 [Acidobacteriia bacterium SbA2]|nr:hypothetical protein SBA2_670003 [Acidobacteriia bacterium SbA2]